MSALPEIKVYEYQELDSTNRLLLDMAKEGAPCGTVVLARRQSGGRGRLGRSFSSPDGGVYISMLVPVHRNGFSLTAKAGVAVKRTIERVCGKKCGIKWVNDIIYEGKKVCGILAQGYEDKAVLGIGVNYAVDTRQFPEDVREIAISLYGDMQSAPPMRTFIDELIDNVYSLVYGSDENWLEEYKGSSTIIGNKVLILKAGSVTGSGTAAFIDDSCFLHVIGDDGKEIVLSTGEISVRNKG
ncbi:MAG: biotin--[acetyl-CoA-carboxylase] ligase [Spirochaetales bacterium]|nr:biotin--[acetyl-CoA-carboxylase] ligase [Spirochaetales bacterium]